MRLASLEGFAKVYLIGNTLFYSFLGRGGEEEKDVCEALSPLSNLSSTGSVISEQTMQLNTTAGSKPNLLRRKPQTSEPEPKAPKRTVRIVACMRRCNHAWLIEADTTGRPKIRLQRSRPGQFISRFPFIQMRPAQRAITASCSNSCLRMYAICSSISGCISIFSSLLMTSHC